MVMKQFEVGQRVSFFDYTQGTMYGVITEVLPAGLYKVRLDGEEYDSIVHGNGLTNVNSI